MLKRTGNLDKLIRALKEQLKVYPNEIKQKQQRGYSSRQRNIEMLSKCKQWPGCLHDSVQCEPQMNLSAAA